MNGTCPDVTGLVPISYSLKLGNIYFFSIILFYFAITLVLFKWLQYKYISLQKRSFINLLIITLGITLELILTSGQNIIDPINIPCATLLWLGCFVIPLIIGGIVIKEALFYYEVQKYKRRSMQNDIIWLTPEFNKRDNHRVWGAFTLMLIATALTVILINSLNSRFNSDCFGCRASISTTELLVPMTQGVVLVIVGAYFYKQNRHVPDPLYIRRDSRVGIIIALSFSLFGYALASIDPGGYQKAGVFDWYLFVFFGFLIMYTIICPFAIFRAWKEFSKMATIVNKEDFKLKLTMDVHFTDKFHQYCREEFSSENYLFFMSVQNFINEPHSDEYNKQFAMKIYEDFIKPGADMQINISHLAKVNIETRLFNGAIDNTLFNEVLYDVTDILYTDTYSRFVSRFKPDVSSETERLKSPHRGSLFGSFLSKGSFASTGST